MSNFEPPLTRPVSRDTAHDLNVIGNMIDLERFSFAQNQQGPNPESEEQARSGRCPSSEVALTQKECEQIQEAATTISTVFFDFRKLEEQFATVDTRQKDLANAATAAQERIQVEVEKIMSVLGAHRTTQLFQRANDLESLDFEFDLPTAESHAPFQLKQIALEATFVSEASQTLKKQEIARFNNDSYIGPLTEGFIASILGDSIGDAALAPDGSKLVRDFYPWLSRRLFKDQW